MVVGCYACLDINVPALAAVAEIGERNCQPRTKIIKMQKLLFTEKTAIVGKRMLQAVVLSSATESVKSMHR